MKKQHRQSERERVFGKRLILRCKDMLSWVLVTLFNCRVGSFCDILLAFSASPHHIKLTYPRINCLNTHFLSSQLPTKLFWFPQKTGLRCAARRTVRELAGRRAADREGTGCSRQLSWLFHCLKNVIIAPREACCPGAWEACLCLRFVPRRDKTWLRQNTHNAHWLCA